MSTLPPEGCHSCGTSVSEHPELHAKDDPWVQPAVTVDTGMAYVVMCPDCAGVDPTEALADLDPECELPPVDLNACFRCNGTGGVQVEWNWDTGAIYDPCTDCDGTGVRPPVELGGAA